jgi:hypothetical protein
LAFIQNAHRMSTSPGGECNGRRDAQDHAEAETEMDEGQWPAYSHSFDKIKIKNSLLSNTHTQRERERWTCICSLMHINKSIYRVLQLFES